MSQTTRPKATVEMVEPGRVRTSPLAGAVAMLARVGAQNLILLGAIVLLATTLAFLNPNFLLPTNLITIGTAVTISGLLALVQTVVMIMGGIDLTVGSVAGLSSVVSAMAFTAFNNAALGVFTALLVGSLCGLINAVVIVVGRVPPMIATLAGLTAFKGISQLVSNGRAQGYTGADPLFRALARGSLLGLPTLVWVLIVTALLLHVMLQFTRVGRNIYAVGGNDKAARLSGIDINRYIVGVFVVSGFVAALAGILITARTGSGQPVSGSEGLEFQAITAAALGGVALRGGKGTIGGTILAVVLLGVLLNGMTLLGVNPFWQNLAQGVLLVVAVVVQQSAPATGGSGCPSEPKGSMAVTPRAHPDQHRPVRRPTGHHRGAPTRGKIASLTSPSHEWLSQPAGELPLRSPCGLGFVEAEMCGWDECAPTIVAGQTAAGTVLSDHGDLWDQAWHWSRTAEALTTWAHGLDWAYTLTRTIRPIEGGFRLDYEVSSNDPGPQPFLWAAHPQFLAEPDSWVELEGVTQLVDFQEPERPLAVDRSLQRVPHGTSRSSGPCPATSCSGRRCTIPTVVGSTSAGRGRPWAGAASGSTPMSTPPIV